MKRYIKYSDIRNAVQCVSWNYYRIFGTLKNNNMIVLYSIWIGFLILFIFDGQIVERIGTMASVLIAGFVCWIHYEKHIKETEKRRKKEMFNSCKVFSENLKLNSQKNSNGNISLDFMGQNGQIVVTSGGDKRRVEWKFDYVALTDECVLEMIERSISVEGESDTIGSFKMIEYKSTKFGSSIKSFAGRFLHKTGEFQHRVSKNFHEYGRDEWELFVANISGTMFEYFQRLISQSQVTKP